MTILMLETIHPDAHEILRGIDETVLSSKPDQVDESINLNKVNAIITRGLGKLDRTLIDACPNLTVVARCGAGLDNIDTNYARSINIPVIFAPGLNASAVAEHTLMLILMIQRSGHHAANEVRASHWGVRNSLVCDDIRNKTLGILGYGRVGQKVAELAAAFNMTLAIYDPHHEDKNTHDSIEELLPCCNMISLHLPLTSQTRNLMDSSRIALMQENSILVNTARGEIVNSEAVVAALNSGHLKGFGADVVSQEPPDEDDPLINHPAAVVTPHVASLTLATYREMCIYTVRNMAAVMRNDAPMPQSVLH